MRNSRLTVLMAAFVVLTLAGTAAGCGSSNSETTGGGSSGGEKLSVGSDVPYPPFEQFGSSKSEFKGFDIELMEAIAEKIGRQVEFHDTSFETIFRDVGQGKFDAEISASTITPEREKEVDFSNPYYLSEQAILVKEGSEITGLSDLAGKKVAAQQGTTGLELGKEKAEASEMRAFPEGPDAINALKAGTVEAVIIDTPVAQHAVENTTGIEIAENVPTEEDYGIAVAQGSSELLEEINQGLKEVEEDGTYTKIFKKWFHAPPPKAIFSATHKAE
jgi:polar amino acid transport system substrate-binding protein